MVTDFRLAQWQDATQTRPEEIPRLEAIQNVNRQTVGVHALSSAAIIDSMKHQLTGYRKLRISEVKKWLGDNYNTRHIDARTSPLLLLIAYTSSEIYQGRSW